MANYYSYLRVSTDEQDVDKDRILVLDYANRIGVGPVHFESETISGKVNWQKRKVATLIAGLKPGDLMIEPEMYRIGRSALEVHLMADAIRQRGAVLHLIREGIVLDGSPMADLMLSVLAGTGQFELRLTSERTKAGLRKAVASGKTLGRPLGWAFQSYFIQDYVRCFGGPIAERPSSGIDFAAIFQSR